MFSNPKETNLLDVLTPSRLQPCNLSKLSLSSTSSRSKSQSQKKDDSLIQQKENNKNLSSTLPDQSLNESLKNSNIKNENDVEEECNSDSNETIPFSHPIYSVKSPSQSNFQPTKITLKNDDDNNACINNDNKPKISKVAFLKIRNINELLSVSRLPQENNSEKEFITNKSPDKCSLIQSPNKSLQIKSPLKFSQNESSSKCSPCKFSKASSTGIEKPDVNDVVELSSDDDNNCFQSNRMKRKDSKRKLIKTKSASTTQKRQNKNKTSTVEETRLTKSQKIQNKTIKSEIDKIKIERRLTKSTNLKTFSAKYLPANQKRIDNFFKTESTNNESVKYFKTFDDSKPSTSDITNECATDYLQIVMNEINRMKENCSGIQLPSFPKKFSAIDDDDVVVIIDSPEKYCENSISNSDKKMKIEDEVNRISNKLHSSKEEQSSFKDVIDNNSSSISDDKTSNVPLSDNLNFTVPQNNSANNNSTTHEARKQLKKTSIKKDSFSKRSSQVKNIKSTSMKVSDLTDNANYLPVIEENKSGIPLRRSNRLGKRKLSSTASTAETVKFEMKSSKVKTTENKNNDDNISLNEKSSKTCSSKLKIRKCLNFKADVDNEEYSCDSLQTDLDLDININDINSAIIELQEFDDTTKMIASPLPSSTILEKTTGIVDLTADDTVKNERRSVRNKNKTAATTTKATRAQRQRKNSSTSTASSKSSSGICPDYKIIKGTTFAVDAFRFGYISGITHYFLTHFHSDHYIGLKKNFTMPIYLSEITAKLVLAIIGTAEQYLNVIQLNQPIIVNDIEITAIDANHCPGAVMFHFKLPDGKCILHTGDFRASPNMESEPIFWNNSMHTVYLDTTYLSSNYDFKPQFESINDAIRYVDEFREKHIGEKILIVCGSYVIGKEKIWMAIANRFNLTVWMDGNRKKTLNAINDPNMLKYLNENMCTAGIHVLAMNKLTNDYLWQYLNEFTDTFDILLALRPSGWEKNSKPQYRGKINIIGIEYSEHSSYNELRRFVRFLQPIELISTVPNGTDLTKTTKIPKNWLQNDLKSHQIGYQSSITNYVKLKRNNDTSTSLSPSTSKLCKITTKNINNSLLCQDAQETDGLILDATKSNITPCSQKSKSLDKIAFTTPNKTSIELNSPQKFT